MNFKSLFKIPYWYLIAVPLLSIGLGAASNQAVLIANWDKFPVMANNERIVEWCKPPAPKNTIDLFQLVAPIAPPVKPPKKHDIFAAQPAHIDVQACSAGGDFFDGDDVHVIMHKESKLKFMADIFDMHGDIFSVGDGLISAGEWAIDWTPLAWLILVIRKFIE